MRREKEKPFENLSEREQQKTLNPTAEDNSCSDPYVTGIHLPSDAAEDHAHGKDAYTHNHPNAKAVSDRLARAIGHLESVKRMVDRGEDCSQVLIQLAAVKSAVNNAGKVLLMDHISHCMVDAVREGDFQKIEELKEAIKNFMK